MSASTIRRKHPALRMGTAGVDRRLRPAALLLPLAVAILAAWARIGLYADGAYAFQRIVVSEGWAVDPARSWLGLVMQAPLVAAARAGISDPVTLHVVFTAGLTISTAAAWTAALWLHRATRLFWAFAVTWAVVYLNTGLFAISEFNLTYALVAAVLAALTAPGPCSAARCACVALVCLLLVRSYEAVVLFGPALAPVALLAARETADRRSRYVLFAAAALLGVAALLAASSILGRIEDATDAARIFWYDNEHLMFSFATWLAVLLGCISRSERGSARWFTAALVFVTLLAFAGGDRPDYHYGHRTAVIAPLVGLSVGAAWWRFGRRSAAALPFPAVGAVAACFCLAILSVDFARHLTGFSSYLDHIESVVRHNRGPVPWHFAAPADDAFRWDWATPVLSLSVQRLPPCTIVLPPDDFTGWQPFDPTRGVPPSLGGDDVRC